MVDKNIFYYIDEGYDNTYKPVQKLINNWQEKNPEWKINEINKYNLEKYIGKDNLENDFEKIKLQILKKYGGLWIEPKIYCNIPLDKWLLKLVEKNNGKWYFKDNNDNLLLIYNKKNNNFNTFDKLLGNENIYINENKMVVENPQHIHKNIEKIPFFILEKIFSESSHKWYYNYLFRNEIPIFIHIGKCGGTTLNQNYLKIMEYHQQKIEPNFNNKYISKKYIIWLRNPISRFVSSFYYLKKCYNIKKKWKSFFSKKIYDELFKRFETVEQFALDIKNILSNEDDNFIDLKNQTENNHIFQGLGFYINNKEIKKAIKNNDVIFVGTLENFDEDFKKLKQKIGKNDDYHKIDKKNVNKNENDDKYLSKKALENIKEFYKGDYEALKILRDYNYISDEYYNSCFYYKYIKDE